MLLLPVVVAALFTAPAASGQNIVIVVIDDVGVERFRTFASPGEEAAAVDTPTIDSIANGGVQFDNFWAYPVCSPFRASLMTGVGPWEHGVSAVLAPDDPGGNGRGLLATRMNIAHMLKGLNRDYRTEAIGKWHMAGTDHGDVRQHPIASGFDLFDGALFNPISVVELAPGDATGYFAWERCDGTSTTPVTCQLERTYSTTYITEKAIACVRGSEPFLCYVAYPAAHVPFHNPPDELHDYDGQCTQGGNGWWSPRNICHKAMIQALDTELARLDAAIDFNDTTLFVVSDNGTTEAAADGPYPAHHNKGTVYQGGLNTPFIVKGEAVTVNTPATVDDIVQTTDIFATLAQFTGSSETTPESKSLMPYLDGIGVTPVRNTVMAEMFLPTGLPAKPNLTRKWFRSSREACYKLIWNFEGGFFKSEVYDLCVDEFETNPLDPNALPADVYEALLAAIRDPHTDDDWDDDTVPNSLDNCLTAPNLGQDDTDADGCGNLCDADYDNNGLVGFPDYGELVFAWGFGDEEKCHEEPISGCTVHWTNFGFFAANFVKKPGPSGTTAGTIACP